MPIKRSYRKTTDPGTPLDVSVINSLKNAVPVKNAQDSAFSPFQVDVRFTLRRGEGSAEAVLPSVGDEGHRVVIEHVTVAASVPDGQGIVAYIKIGEIKHALVLTLQRGWSNPRYRASQPIKLYSLGGGAGFGFAGVERTATSGSASFYFTVSGYLVDLP
jgi:hypothetical protein